MNWTLGGEDQTVSFFRSGRIDERFVGVWRGTDHGKFFKGETNSWIVNRRADGTFMISFKTIHADDNITYSEEEGFWCIKENDYYEYKESDEKMDRYSFLFLAKDSIHFTINEPLLKEEPYNFVDFKVILD